MNFIQTVSNSYFWIINKTQSIIKNLLNMFKHTTIFVLNSKSEENIDYLYKSSNYVAFIYQNYLFIGILIFMIVSIFKLFYMNRTTEEVHVPLYRIKSKKYWNFYNLFALLLFILSWMFYLIYFLSNISFSAKLFNSEKSNVFNVLSTFLLIVYLKIFIILFHAKTELSLTYKICIFITLIGFSVPLDEINDPLGLFLLMLIISALSNLDTIPNFYEFARKFILIFFKKFFSIFGLYTIISSVFFFLSLVFYNNLKDQNLIEFGFNLFIAKNLSIIFLMLWTYRLFCKMFSTFCSSLIYLESIKSRENTFKKSIYTLFTVLPQLLISTLFSTFYIFSLTFVLLSIFNNSDIFFFDQKMLLFLALLCLINLIISIYEECIILPYIAIYDGDYDYNTFNKSFKRFNDAGVPKFSMIITKIFVKNILLVLMFLILSIFSGLLRFSKGFVFEINIFNFDNIGEKYTALKIFFTFMFLIFIESLSIGYYAIHFYLRDMIELGNRDN